MPLHRSLAWGNSTQHDTERYRLSEEAAYAEVLYGMVMFLVMCGCVFWYIAEQPSTEYSPLHGFNYMIVHNPFPLPRAGGYTTRHGGFVHSGYGYDAIVPRYSAC
jgi:hypothetical protein